MKLAGAVATDPIYIATARIWDDDFKSRINRHRSDRGKNWITIEEEISIGNINCEGKTVVLDCVTLWLTNIFFDAKNNLENSLERAKKEWDTFIHQDFILYVVSNELGMGVHPENEVARKFADLQGWVNQYIAGSANEVFLMVSGIPLKLK